jgi:hypothetical protein
VTAILLRLLAALADDARFFDKRAAPLLSRRCLACHNEELKNANISFLIGSASGQSRN